MDNQFNFEGSPMPPKPEKPQKNRDGYATASLVLGIVALVLSCPCCCSAISLKRNGKNGKAIAGLVLGIVALLIVIIVVIAIIASPSDPDLPTDQAMIERMYQWIEKYAGKEAADEWYQAMQKALQNEGNGTLPAPQE